MARLAVTLVLLLATPSLAHSPLLRPWDLPLSSVGKTSGAEVEWRTRVQRAMPSLEQMINNFNTTSASRAVSDQCRNHLLLYASSLATYSTWAISMFDASTKFPESLLSGATAGLGNFDQCLATQASLLGQVVFSAQYCLPTLSLSQGDFTLNYMFATCMPGSCTAAELQEAIQFVVTPPLSGLGEVQVSLDQSGCYTGEDKPSLSAGAIATISFFCAVDVLLIIATLYDLLVKNKTDNKGSKVLLSFSLGRNLRTLMSVRHAPGSVKCLHGLRVLSLFWIILSHRYGTDAFKLNINPLQLLEWLSQVSYQVVLNAYVGVDTFFFMSGFLLCYVFLNDLTKGRPFNLAKFYLYRYLRLTTALLAVVLYYMFLMQYTGYSPTWRRIVDYHVNVCQRDWYLAITYLNNYIYRGRNFYTCPEQGWYLSVDMQLSWVSPLLLVPLWKWPRVTSRLILPIVILTSCLAPFIYTYVHRFPMASDFLGTDPDMGYRWVIELYQPGHMRATPYLVGIALAFFMFEFRNYQLTLSKWLVALGWLLSTVIALSVLLGPAAMYQPGYQYDPFVAGLYAGFHRLGWSVSLAWIVFACSRGYGGWVDSVLSWPALLPLSRLCYCGFLTQFILFYYDSGHSFTLGYISHFGIVQRFLSDLFMNSWMAIILYLGCEAPTLNLLYIFFARGQHQVTKVTLEKDDVKVEEDPGEEKIVEIEETIEEDNKVNVETS